MQKGIPQKQGGSRTPDTDVFYVAPLTENKKKESSRHHGSGVNSLLDFQGVTGINLKGVRHFISSVQLKYPPVSSTSPRSLTTIFDRLVSEPPCFK